MIGLGQPLLGLRQLFTHKGELFMLDKALDFLLINGPMKSLSSSPFLAGFDLDTG